ncbi:gamma-glutamyltransferase [Flavihumibacter fluvii]|uniref:gamma-glutamyltransferase n=1 Tax=Flavihumibacter fluvii TaxID=2838157 RepID=UPI001BDE6DD6|nr:gamma-glutamyltransferase [Flavihumibacter fluvii]ULQ53114.1 gamma-glutamyltransferase [Flavihumibacter fluvii]
MKFCLSLVAALHLFLATFSQSSFDPYNYSIQKTYTGRNGAVVTAHPLASQVGVSILKKGGNAVDAAIATQLALAVVYPGAGNIGGGGFMVVHLENGKNTTIDFREKAPLQGHRDMYLDAAGNAIMDKSQNGHLAAGVPGTIAGMFAAKKYSKLPFTELIQPAIDLAEKGFVITAAEAESLNEDRANFIKYNTRPTAFVKDIPWKAGDTLIQKELAQTLQRIKASGQKGFYEGETARLIVEEMKRGNGIINFEDLKKYDAKERTPSTFNYKGHEVITMPLPSSGGVLLPMMLKMTSRFPIADYGFHSLKAVQLMTEIERLAYADRAKFLGDPDFYKVPVKYLTSDAYITERLRLYHADSAGNSKNIQAGTVEKESEETTHFSVVDKKGNAVSVTTTLNGGYGCYTVVGGAGFLLNNEMDDFSVKPGVPNMYGAVGGEANAIEPGKRMLSSMTPTIVLKNNKPYIVAGTPGGTTITTSVYQTLLNLIDFRLNTADAVNKPKFHMQWLPDQIFAEDDFPDDIVSALQKMGYTVTKRGKIGRTDVIRILPDGTIEAVGDKRGDDTAAGY